MIRNALTPERSNVQCSLLDWTDKNAKLVVSNKGVRPAVVQRAEIVLDTPDGSKNSVILNPTESDPTLEPGKYRVLIFSDPNLEAPSGHPELSAILSALKGVPEPRDYPSGDGLVQFWNNPPVLEVLGGTLYAKATPTTMESLVYLGDLQGSLKSKAITISFEVKPKDYDSFRAVHCALALYALAMDAKARHASKNVINDLLAEARGLLPETAANTDEIQQELLKAVKQEEALNAK